VDSVVTVVGNSRRKPTVQVLIIINYKVHTCIKTVTCRKKEIILSIKNHRKLHVAQKTLFFHISTYLVYNNKVAILFLQTNNRTEPSNVP
jgi:hypothetical protein